MLCLRVVSEEEFYHVFRTTPTITQVTHRSRYQTHRDVSVYTQVTVVAYRLQARVSVFLPCRKYTPEHISAEKKTT
jgi:hypothetical protein